LAPGQIERPPRCQKTAPHLGFNLQGGMSARELAACACHGCALTRDLHSKSVCAVQIRQGAFKQKLAFRAVASPLYKLTPERLRTLGKMFWRLRNRALCASFHVSKLDFGHFLGNPLKTLNFNQ
jgi:hypothetical protein